MATLYELEDNLKLIQSMIEEGADESIFDEALENIKLDLADKLEGYAMVIKNIESDVEGYKAEEKRLSTRRKSMESKIKRMKENMKQAMITANEEKINGERFSFTVKKNPPSLNLVDESIIPKEFLIQVEPKIDNAAIKERLLNEEVIPGAEITQGKSILIR